MQNAPGPSAARADQLKALDEQHQRLFYSTVEILGATLDRRDPDAGGYSKRVALITEILARSMDLTPLEVEKLRVAGLLHDIGKVGVPDSILTFHGPLTVEMEAVLRNHVRISREILEQVEFPAGFEDVASIVAQYHERLSGSGYPNGETGDTIGLGARILAVADMYDALRVRRTYTPSRTPSEVLTFLRSEVERGELDWSVVAALDRVLDEVEAACAPLRPPA
jgi:putative nucleotidyltransferase with HDIG domain